MNGKEVQKLLEKDGYILFNINGSHHYFMKGNVKVTVPFTGKKIYRLEHLRQSLNKRVLNSLKEFTSC